ncbi:MAG: hypothetical protein K6E83_10150 [Clostridium sp.]|nr:hypothetical protein [Clostridium sp.]
MIFAGQAFAGTWHKDGSAWRYTDERGHGVNSGWVQDQGSWYYLKPDSTGSGAMQTGWVQDDDGDWYYLSPSSGALVTGWQPIDGLWYYLDPTDGGAMALNREVDGFYINAKGVWTNGDTGLSISVSKGSNNSSASSKDRSSTTTRTRHYRSDDEDYDDEDEDYDEDEDSSEIGEDSTREWDESYSDDGPGLELDEQKTTGPGAGMESNVGERWSYDSSQTATPGSYSSRGRDGSFYDDEEAGGSKEDFLYNQAQYYQNTSKDAGDYDGNYGSKYSYSTSTVVDDNGDTRTIIEKERNEDEDEDED